MSDLSLRQATRDAGQSSDVSGSAERALVIVPEFVRAPEEVTASGVAPRSLAARLEEAEGLARAIDLDIVQSGTVKLKKTTPATLFGTGKTEEIAGIVKSDGIGLAIVDTALTPVQQRNLEKSWHCKVLDRTGLILEIFGERARTREGRLQVELAHLNYQKGRLVRQWTHLERQRGGLGKTGGPGETQIEADRRLLQTRILRLEKDLAKVRRTRQLHRSKRKKRPSQVVALVGYTNAGKSTLFNKMTEAGVLAKDMLFATLDPTLRKLRLPLGTDIVLSDTVGFVSDLPTTLVAAFRATLEEVIEADLILHVRDVSDNDHAAQSEDVYSVLEQIGIDETERGRILEVWNKIDKLEPESLEAIRATKTGANNPDAPDVAADGPLLVSAVTGQGIDALLKKIEQRLSGELCEVEIELQSSDLSRLPWLYEHANVQSRTDGEDGSVRLQLQMTKARRSELRRFGLETAILH